ncbi:MAG: hypothetical protein UZ11_BCD004000097 [Bacteroidetes bacterium OLB11]|nr:MAG: hypothetical protein UZ11_BCD004000097 [Bacteroidetes bacterium OLB11]
MVKIINKVFLGRTKVAIPKIKNENPMMSTILGKPSRYIAIRNDK